MEKTKYIWHQGKLVLWEEATVHVLTHTLHYGGGAFEGIRIYKTEKGGAVFRLPEHIKRLFYSAEAIGMKVPFTQEQIKEATIELLAKNELHQGYIRPIIYYGYGIMGLNPRGAPVEGSIMCWPWDKYLPHEMVDIKTSKYIRIHPGSTIADAKICGHYVNSILAALEVRGGKYQEALFLDANGDVTEGPGENIFIVKDGKLITPQLGSILPGITRDTAIQIATSFGISVVQTRIKVEDIYNADEAFFTGTAAEITPIRSLDDKVIGTGEIGPLTKRIKDTYSDIVYGRNAKFNSFLTYVQR